MEQENRPRIKKIGYIRSSPIDRKESNETGAGFLFYKDPEPMFRRHANPRRLPKSQSLSSNRKE
jgi:hypothetical protein